MPREEEEAGEEGPLVLEMEGLVVEAEVEGVMVVASEPEVEGALVGKGVGSVEDVEGSGTAEGPGPRLGRVQGRGPGAGTARGARGRVSIAGRIAGAYEKINDTL